MRSAPSCWQPPKSQLHQWGVVPGLESEQIVNSWHDGRRRMWCDDKDEKEKQRGCLPWRVAAPTPRALGSLKFRRTLNRRQEPFQRRCHNGGNEWPRESAGDSVVLTGRRDYAKQDRCLGDRPLFQKWSKIQNGNIGVILRSAGIFLGLDLTCLRMPRRFALDSRLIAPGNKGLRCWAKCRVSPQPSRSLQKFAQHKPRPQPKRKVRSSDWQNWLPLFVVQSSLPKRWHNPPFILLFPFAGSRAATQLSVSMV